MQWAVAAGCAGTLAWLAFEGEYWPFDEDPKPVSSIAKPSVWDYLLADRVTMGFVRFALVGLALFTVVSVLALVIARRWLKGFGTMGLAADDAQDASATIEKFETQAADLARELADASEVIDTLTRERDEARNVAREVLFGMARAEEQAQQEERQGEERQEDEPPQAPN
jgi:hypothetical protein